MPAPPFTPFRPEEFRLFEDRHRGDETLNAKRLAVRKRLQSIGEAAQAALGAAGLSLERRESLHHPFHVNHHRVVAQWTSLLRDAKARRAFARAVGPDLGKDVDPGHANLAFFVAIDEAGLQFGLRLGVEAWYDAQNFVNRAARNEAESDRWREALREARGCFVRIHDFESRFAAETLTRDQARDLFKYFRVGTHRLVVARAVGKDDPLATAADFLEEAVAGLRALAPVYAFMAWSPENDHLLRGDGAFRS